jgi:hypothetical protein
VTAAAFLWEKQSYDCEVTKVTDYAKDKEKPHLLAPDVFLIVRPYGKVGGLGGGGGAVREEYFERRENRKTSL